jgi:hypothetical protein
MNSRIFTVEEANSLVPQLSALVGPLLTRANEIEAQIEKLGTMRPQKGGGRVPLDPAPGDSPELRARKAEILAEIRAYEEGWRDVQELGVVVKDPRIGLCDFYGCIDGRIVFLCWRYGESSIEHYHPLDSGFAGRKPLGAEVRQRLLN